MAIARSTPSRSPRVQASEICRCSAELAPNSKRNWKKLNPQAYRYAPDPSGPIASSTSRVVHSENDELKRDAQRQPERAAQKAAQYRRQGFRAGGGHGVGGRAGRTHGILPGRVDSIRSAGYLERLS